MENQKNGRIGENKTQTAVEELYEKWTGTVAKIFRAMTAKERFLALAAFVFTGMITFFAAEKGIPYLPSEAGGGLIRPLGDAILCAASTYTPAAYIALTYSAYLSNTAFLPRWITITAIFALRTGLGLHLSGEKNDLSVIYRENAAIKIGSAALLSLFTVGIRLSDLPLSQAALPEILSMLLLTPAITAILYGAFADKTSFDAANHRKKILLYCEISTYIFFALSVYALKGHTFLGSSLSALAAIFLTVITAVKGGMIRGGAVGALLGLSLSTRYAPILTATGIAAAALSGFGVAATVGLSCVAGVFVAVYAYGYGAVLNYVPESIIATAITSPVLKYGFLSENFPIPNRRIRRCEGKIKKESDAARGETCCNMLRRLSNGFASLSQAPSELQKHSATSGYVPDGEYVCNQLKQGFCDTCPLVCICWDNGGNIAKGAVKRAISAIYSSERITESKYGSHSRERFKCIRPTEIKKEIIRICETPEAKATALPPPPMGFFEDCLCISDLLRNIAEMSEGDNLFDRAAASRSRRALSALGIGADELAVYGDRVKTAVIYGVDQHSLKEDPKRITEALSLACGCTFSAPAVLSEDKTAAFSTENTETRSTRGNERDLIFKSIPPHKTETALLNRKATGEERNGDSAEFITTDSGYFHSILCDGMGSGTEAANCSQNAVNTVKSLLECRVSPTLAAKLTGNAVKQGYNECFTTLDLLTVDLTNGKAQLLKSGAACSYLLRNGEPKHLSAPSLPLGIAYETIPESIELVMQDGDLLIMISDGMADTEEDEYKLAERLGLLTETDPKRIAERLISAAIADAERNGKTKRCDDMTVAVIKLTHTDSSTS